MERNDVRLLPSTSRIVENLVDGNIGNNIDVNDPIINYLVKNEGLLNENGRNEELDIGSDDSDLEVLIEEHILLEKLKQFNGNSEPTSSEPQNENLEVLDLQNKDATELLAIKAKIEEAMHINLKIRQELLSMERKLVVKYKEACMWEEENIKIVKKAEIKARFNPVGPSDRFLDQFRNPYFKANGLVAPRNSDSEKLSNTNLPYIPDFDDWTDYTISNLCGAIRKYLISEQTSLRRKKKSINSQEPTVADLRRLQNAPLYELVKDREDDSFDWKEISVYVNQALFTEKECRLMWSLFLKPSLVEWTSDENENLLKISMKYNLQNWDKIAEELDSGRSGFSCFLQCQSTRALEWNDGKWSKEENEHLHKVIENSKINDRISWDKVHYFIDTKYIDQIYSKWNAFSAPNISKGKFSEREDKILLGMVHKFGTDLRSVATVLKHRSLAQVTARYKDHILPHLNFKTGEWTVEEDEKLLKLVKQHGECNWALIAKDFQTRSRVQIRHRYKVLKTKLQENPDLNLNLLYRPKRPTSKKRIKKNRNFLNKVISTKVKNIRSILKINTEPTKHKKKLKSIDKRLDQYFRMKFVSNDIKETVFEERLKEFKKNHQNFHTTIEDNTLRTSNTTSLISTLKFSMFALRNLYEARETDEWCLKDRTSFHKGILELATLNEQTSADLQKWHKEFCSLFAAGTYMSHIYVSRWKTILEEIAKKTK